MNKSREDKQFEKDIKHMYRDGTAMGRLRRMEQKRTPNSECSVCIRLADKTFPLTIWACNKCVSRICRREGNITIEERMNSFVRNPCEICENPRITLHKIHIRACEKCLKRMANRHTRGEFRDHNERYKKGILKFARTVA